MKQCPQCNNKYPEPNDFCLVDGIRLLELDQQAETLNAQLSSSVIGAEFMYKDFTLTVGEYFDFQSRLISARITLLDIIEASFDTSTLSKKTKEFGAKVGVKTQLLKIAAGTEVIKDGDYYLIPASKHHEQEFSLYHFFAAKDLAILFRFFVEHINPHSKQVEFNIALLRYPG